MTNVNDGSSFFTSDDYGDAYGLESQGFFYRDTRFLSKAILTVNGQKLKLVSSRQVDYFSACFFMTLPLKGKNQVNPLTIIRTRLLGEGNHEEIIFENYSKAAIDLTIHFEFDSDFADIFEIKNGQSALGNKKIKIDKSSNELVFTYDIETLHRETHISCDQPPQDIEDQTFIFKITVPPKGKWQTCFAIKPVWDHDKKEPKYACHDFGNAKPQMAESMASWLDRTPKLTSDRDTFELVFKRCIVDLAALRFYLPWEPKTPVLAAGLPWYMALFGRDSLITAYQTCYLAPDISEDILRTLAHYQGKEVNDFRDEEPGKILHELRFGELTALHKTPHNPYYGTADSTPLFLILLHEVYRWTGNKKLVNELKEAALNALKWMDDYGDLDGDGYIEYHKRSNSSQGLNNQCWKDSWNSMLFSDGHMAQSPMAAVEIQGYQYRARLCVAELAETVWNDTTLAQKLNQQADTLKKKFNRDFWIDDKGGYFALALDKDKKPVDSMTSNMGQLLWSGIVDKDKADKVVSQLMNPDMFSGYGIRSMSKQDEGFDPIEYHNGTVWPHDNSFIAEGLINYGYRDEANQIIQALHDAAYYFDYRLPEVFAGYDRHPINFPVNYPTACSPQAWATGTPILLMRILLGLEPNLDRQTIEAKPHLPPDMKNLTLQNIRLFGKQFNIHVDRKTTEIHELGILQHASG